MFLPQIRLSAMTAATGPVNTTISTDEATFVNGIFAAGIATLSTPGAPEVISPINSNGLKFAMPGTTLGIFPIGFIITGSWAVAFVGVVGYGTVGRLRFRDQYRRRIKRELVRAGAVKTI